MIIDKCNYKDFMSDDTSMNCSHSNITEIRYLPDGLETLYCNKNRLPIEGAFYNKEEINEFKIKLDNIIKLEKFLL